MDLFLILLYEGWYGGGGGVKWWWIECLRLCQSLVVKHRFWEERINEDYKQMK